MGSSYTIPPYTDGEDGKYVVLRLITTPVQGSWDPDSLVCICLVVSLRGILTLESLDLLRVRNNLILILERKPSLRLYISRIFRRAFGRMILVSKY